MKWFVQVILNILIVLGVTWAGVWAQDNVPMFQHGLKTKWFVGAPEGKTKWFVGAPEGKMIWRIPPED